MKPIKYKAIELLPTEFTIRHGTDTLRLKRKEFDILQLLFQNPKQIFTRDKLYEMIWNSEFTDENTINVHLSNLRHKLHILDPDNEYIETIWGIGVRLA